MGTAIDRAEQEVAILASVADDRGWTREAVQQGFNACIAIAIAIRAHDSPSDAALFPLACAQLMDGIADFIESGGRVVFIDPKEDA